jgi:DNA-binding transcriptional regulator LsrR (DeoR family)
MFVNESPDGASLVTEIKRNQKHSFTDDEIAQMVIDYTDHHLKVYQLADKYGCYRTTISKVLKKNGVSVTRNRMDEATIVKAEQLYTDGLTLKQVGQELSICESVIRKTLLRAGVEMREPHRYI